MAGKARVVQMVRSVGVLIVCSHVDCGDPRSGAVVGQVVDIRYARQANMLAVAAVPRIPMAAGSMDSASSAARASAVAGAGIDYDRLAEAMSRVQIGAASVQIDGREVGRAVRTWSIHEAKATGTSGLKL